MRNPRAAPATSGSRKESRPSASLVFLARDVVDGRWGSRQHLALRLSRRHPLVYVEDAVRRPGVRGHRMGTGPGGLPTLTPTEWPFQRFAPLRRMAARSIAGAVRAGLPGPQAPLAAVVYPRARLDVLRALRPDAVLFHAVDDYSEYADGSPDRRYLEWEEEVRSLADRTVAVSRPLERRLREAGFRGLLCLPLGFDESLRDRRPGTPPPEIASRPGPVLGFVGTVRAGRLDLPSVRTLADAIPEATLVFVGEEFDDRNGSLAELRRRPNVSFLGFRPPEEAAAFVAALSVAVVPYAATRDNLRCFPLKVVDALALGRPVVLSPPRPDIEEFRGVVRFASDPESFVREVRAALAEGQDPARVEARKRAVAHLGWDRLAERLEGVVLEALREHRSQPM